MSVLIVTSVGDIVVDLHTDRCPLTTKNFLKLCKLKYYNGCLFHKVEKDFMAQTGDRTGTGTGGDSVYKFLFGNQARFFEDEIHPDVKHSKIGTVAMASAGENCNASQFYFTLRDDLDYLDGKHTVFGIVEEKEGLDTLVKINEAFVDDNGRPFKDIRIKHTYILDDPFDDPSQLAEFIPEKSPEGKPPDEKAEERLEDNWVPMDVTLSAAELEEVIHAKEAHTNAAILESIGDIPDADVKPPENVLFVCKLNPVTQDEDLYTIFSRFGNVTSADIIRDYKTGDSLCYAFIEFETNEDCERAYFKMDNTLIDDRRIHVDFSQSVSNLWRQFRHGKRNQTNTGGCFKCGGDHIARDCDQDANNNNRGTKYVLKNENTQHGGDDRERYAMLFDEDEMENMENQGRTKKRKEDRDKSEHTRDEDYDKKGSERRRGDDVRSRGSRDERGSRRGDEYSNDKATGEKGGERYEDRGHQKRHESSSSRHRADEGDHRRSSGSSHHEREHRSRDRDSDRNRRDDGHYERKSRDRDSDRDRQDGGHYERKNRDRDSDRNRRDDGHYERKSIHRDDSPYRDKRHRS